MIAVCVTFTVKPGMMDAFMESMEQQARQSVRTEPGCRRFDVCARGDDPQVVFLYELYEDHAAFRTHLDSSHFRSFDARVKDMVARKTVGVFGHVMEACSSAPAAGEAPGQDHGHKTSSPGTTATTDRRT